MKRSGSISWPFRVVDANFDANYLVPNRCSRRDGPLTISDRADETLQTLQRESVLVSSALVAPVWVAGVPVPAECFVGRLLLDPLDILSSVGLCCYWLVPSARRRSAHRR